MCEQAWSSIDVIFAAYLIVDEAPLLKERMNSHDGANITRKIAAACSNREVLDGVQAISVDHEVAVVLVHGRGLASVTVVEEFTHRLALNVVDGVHVEPGAVAGQHDGVRLGDKMFSSGGLGSLLGLGVLALIAVALGSSLLQLLSALSHLLIAQGCGIGARCVGGIEGVIRQRAGRRRMAVLLHRGGIVRSALRHLDVLCASVNGTVY